MIKNNKLSFEILKKAKVTSNNLKWLNDPKVRYYSTVKKKHTLRSQKEFLTRKLNDKSVILFKIIYHDLHIGNLEISKINKFHKHCEISYLIGEKKFWRIGLGTKVIRFVVDYAKNNLKMKKIIAGTFCSNKASIGVLVNNGFKKEGIIKNLYLDNSKKYRIHHLWLGKNL